ncbi:hypothetical protein B0A79_15550 [Flavobacterium piscis]|uniref:Uncharacterized protein n=1 Tax=Flavobacterium piscis TaxID=1114874 RepID=A0ABX2XPL7_9FLAO|nr:hypothetical protein FLP_00505 [Flavobacterium piscis]OXG02364.1 hypothetical protein B0A79_15550 [Flavobacterium piscis]
MILISTNTGTKRTTGFGAARTTQMELILWEQISLQLLLNDKKSVEKSRKAVLMLVQFFYF